MNFNFLKNTLSRLKQDPIQGILVFCLYIFLFLFPWQTILIFQKNENGTLGIFGFEILLFAVGLLYIIKIIVNFCHPESFATLEGKLREGSSPSNRGKIIFPQFIKKQSQKKYSQFQKILFLFFLYCFFSIFFAPQKLFALFQTVRIAEAFFLYYILTHFQYKKSVAVGSLLVGSALQSVLGIYQFLTQSTVSFKWLGLVSHPVFETGSSVVQSIEVGRILRAYGAFPHPNVFGGYLVVSIIFTTIFFIKSFCHPESFATLEGKLRERSSKKIFPYIFLLVIQITALFFTFSRSTWLAVVFWFTGIFFYFFKKRNKKMLFLFLLLILQVVFLCTTYFSLLKTRVEAKSYHETRSVEERKNLSAVAFQLFQTHPWFGVGVGNYVSAVKIQNPLAAPSALEPVHMVPLFVLVEFGIFGILIFIIFMVLCVKTIKWKPLAWFFLFTLSPLLLFDHYLYSLPFGIFLGATFFGLLQHHSFSTPTFFCPCSGSFSSIDKKHSK